MTRGSMVESDDNASGDHAAGRVLTVDDHASFRALVLRLVDATPGLGGLRATAMIKAQRPSTIVVLISTTHPDDLPRAREESLADEIIWKSDLRSSVLAEIWQWHRGR